MIQLHPVTPLHMGALHPYEQALTLILAFGPVLVLGVVIWLRSREDGQNTNGQDTGGD